MMILVRIDRHEARHTDARTWWTTSDGKPLETIGRRVWSSAAYPKTHWEEFWEVPNDTLLIRHRISNRGNYNREIYSASQLQASPDEIPPTEVE